MHIVSSRILLFCWSFSLIQCTSEPRSNVPIIKSSSPDIFFEEQFQDKNQWTYWTKSQARKEGVEEHQSKYDGQWAFEISESSVYQDDYSLILKVTKKTWSFVISSFSIDLVQRTTSCDRCSSPQTLRFLLANSDRSIRSEIPSEFRMWWSVYEITFLQWKTSRFGSWGKPSSKILFNRTGRSLFRHN